MNHTPDAFDRQQAEEDPEILCRSCQAECYWQEVYNKYGIPGNRLFEGGKQHVCKPSADDFEVVS